VFGQRRSLGVEHYLSIMLGIIEQLIAKMLVAAELERSPIPESIEKKKK